MIKFMNFWPKLRLFPLSNTPKNMLYNIKCFSTLLGTKKPTQGGAEILSTRMTPHFTGRSFVSPQERGKLFEREQEKNPHFIL